MRVDLPDPRSVLGAMLARFAQSAGVRKERAADRSILVEDARLHRREWLRNVVRIPTDVVVVLEKGKRRFTTGTGEIRDISLKGARLVNLKLRKPALPLVPFHLHLRFRGKRYDGIEARCVPRRFVVGDNPELGVQFVDLWVQTSASPDRSPRKRSRG